MSQDLHPEFNPPSGNRILWKGPLFGRLSKTGKEYLIRKGGWKEVDDPANNDDDNNIIGKNNERLQFIWPNKSGPQFEMQDTKAAHIRPYPKTVTDILDDKLRLAKLLKNHYDLAPPTIERLDQVDVDPYKLYFVKHRFGAQGKSVYAYNKKKLEAWWERSKNPSEFVIQEEVIPALDEQGRKFVLRAHCLMMQRSNDPSLQSFLHRDIICLPHAAAYPTQPRTHDSAPSSAYISQIGKKHPPPILYGDLPPHHPAEGHWDAIRRCMAELILLATTGSDNSELPPPLQQEIGEQTTCFALLGADLLVARDGRIQICEVNSHPAFGWGTMSQVPTAVFQGLIEDSLSIVVFDEKKESNQYERLNVNDS